jgi:tungstate transport system substrate-binding protein
MNRRSLVFAAFFALAALGAGAEPRQLKLATTTSAQATGLLDHLLPAFEKKYAVEVQVIAVGAGKALKLGENGDVDVLMVHAPKEEEKFVAAGFGVNRRPFMKNDFVIVGPVDDPAGVKKAKALAEAMKILKDNGKAVFISRGDNSGTHIKELELWALAGGQPPVERYLEIGQGMEEALRMASEKKAYTLSDRGAWLALRKKLALAIVFEKDPALDNQYSMIAVNPQRWPEVNFKDAMALIDWLTSAEGQAMIAAFKVDGEQLFYPNAVPGK